MSPPAGIGARLIRSIRATSLQPSARHGPRAAWGMHLDFGPGTSGGALYPFVQCMSAQAKGLQIAEGGAGAVTNALVGLFKEKGGELTCSSGVEEIVTQHGVATAVVSNGRRISAGQAVIANLTPTNLATLLTRDTRTALHRKARRYRYGPNNDDPSGAKKPAGLAKSSCKGFPLCACRAVIGDDGDRLSRGDERRASRRTGFDRRAARGRRSATGTSRQSCVVHPGSHGAFRCGLGFGEVRLCRSRHRDS